ncbi:MAG: myxosortase MrtP [Persicimonas sp.]
MSDETTQQTDEGEPTARRLSLEATAVFVAGLLLVLGCVLLAEVVPFVSQNLYVFVAAVFVGLPYWWMRKSGLDFERFGLTWEDAGRGAVWGLAFTALTLVPFAVGYWWWQTEVNERAFHWSADNFWQWPVELEGRPDPPADAEGVWVWSDGPTLHISLRADDEPVAVEVSADDEFRPAASGAVDLETAGPDQADSARTFRAELAPDEGRRAHLSVGPNGERAHPKEITVEPVGGGDAPPVYRGAAGERTEGPLEAERGLNWMLLWALTHLVFIALPEEFFYRGFLQTRIGQALAARRAKRGDDASPRRFFGLISAKNLITSALFALGHLLIPIGGALSPARASVFFPSLAFGWLRERTGTIAAPVVYHATANLMILFAAPHFF